MMQVNPFGVRKAQPADAEALFSFLMPILAETALQPISEIKVEMMVRQAVCHDGAIAGIIEGLDGIEASIGLFVETFPYSDALHVRDRWLGVREDKRRLPHGSHLLKFAQWAQQALQTGYGQPLPLFLEILTRRQLEPKMRLYQRHSSQVGAFFSCGSVPADAFSQRRLGNGKAA
jgi:GNAT superfamily N-acetyltransferase